MFKKSLSLLIAFIMLISSFPLTAFASQSEEDALGEIGIVNGGYEMKYLKINGNISGMKYTYFNYTNITGTTKPIPAYCVNPTLKGVTEVVGSNSSIKYNAAEKSTDPKVVGIVANGYPHRSLKELGLSSTYQGYYATKAALWCYLIPQWDINKAVINSDLSEQELEDAKKVLAATKDIYSRGTQWTSIPQASITTQTDNEYAYPVTVDGKDYKQQIITVHSDSWVCDYTINVDFSDKSSVPSGTKIVDSNNKEISAITTSATGNGYEGSFKILYPADSVENQTGNIQLSLKANVYKYAVFYAVCAEKDRYGNIQNYLADTDPTTQMNLSAISKYKAESPSEPDDTPTPEKETGLEIIKLETGTKTPLSGAIFEVVSPDGDHIGSFSTDSNGKIYIPLYKAGNYTVTETTPPKYHLPSEKQTQNVTVRYNEVSTVTFENALYGDLRIEKTDASNGNGLEGAVIQIKHIETGKTFTQKTATGGSTNFTDLTPGAYEIKEITAPEGYQLNKETYTVNVEKGSSVSYAIKDFANPGIRIIKRDSKTNILMADTTFEVYKDTVLLGTYTTNQLGEILLTNLEAGTYFIKEIATDNSHIVNSTSQQIELKAGQNKISEIVFFNNVKPGISLIKVDSTTMAPLANTKFLISKVGGSFSKEFITDKNGEISLNDLEPGSYTVKEITAPDGYIVDDDIRIIQINGNENAQFVFTNTPKPSLSLLKFDPAAQKYLSGAVFRIAKIEDGSNYLDRITDTNGKIQLDNLDPGIYSVKEVSAPNGYILNEKEYHVELFLGKTSQIVVENLAKPNLLIVKTDAVTGKRIKGVTFTVNKADSSTLTTVETDENGEALLEKMETGIYKITEKSVPDNYLLNETPQLITLEPNKTGIVRFENYQKPNLTINKVDSITKDPLKGAKFNIVYASNNTFTGEINDLGKYTTDENGQIILENLNDGWYKITEIEAPAGYEIKDPSSQEVYIKAGTGKTVTFENTPLSGIVIKKVDADTGEVLQGAKFRLRYLSGISGTGGTVIGEYETSAQGTVVITGLKAGTYIVGETKAPDGYIIDDAPETVYITGNEQSVIEVEFENKKDSGLIIKKLDSKTNKPLAGAKFKITTSSGTVAGTDNGEYTTDESGIIHITDLPTDTYIIQEISAPEGYMLDNTAKTIKLKHGETSTLTFYNTPESGLIIKKYDSTTKHPLSGAVFKVTNSEGIVVGEANGKYKTDSNGIIHITNLPSDTYIVQEISAPEGYILDETTQTIKLKNGEIYTVEFFNTPKAELTITKLDEETRQVLKNAEFDISKMNGEHIGTYRTDSNGRISLSNLESGWYTITEKKAPKGYTLDSEPHNIEVKNGKSSSIEIKNRKSSSILIHKIDSITGKGIYGVTFLVSDSKNNPVGQYTSDQDGYVYIDKELSDGKYYVREIKAAEGYIIDTDVKTFYVEYGGTSEITWKNTPQTGQIQITKKSADENSINGLPAGTRLPNAQFEIYSKAGNLVDTVVTDKNGIASSKLLPIGRYTIVETKTPMYYSKTSDRFEAEIEFSGQIVRIDVLNSSIFTNVSVTKRGYAQVMPSQTIRYDFKNIKNNSTVSLNSFYWRDTLPVNAVRLEKIITGTWTQKLSYKIVYKTNLKDYRTLADNLITSKNYVLGASSVALGLADNEYVTEIMFVFGTVNSDFSQVEPPYIYCKVNGSLPHEYRFTNNTDVGGLYNGQWIMSADRWVTVVYNKTTQPILPKTGY